MVNHEEVFQMRIEDSVSLSKDVLIDLLIYLPVKSLMRFKSVSKYWCDLIKCPTFVNRHLQRDDCGKTILVKRYIPLMNGNEDIGGDDVLSFHDPKSPELLVSPNIFISFFKEVFDVQWARYTLDVLGPCNGIVCLDSLDAIAFSNPALHEFRVLDSCPFASPEGYSLYMYGSGFGFDAITNSYKFIRFRQMVEKEMDLDDDYDEWMRIDLCNLSSNFWKIVEDVVPPINCQFEFNLLFNGAYHWNATNFHEDPIKGTILSFDIQDEVFRRFVFPWCDDDRRYPSLVVLDQCLAIIHHGGYHNKLGEIDIWIMKEYGVEESWRKELVIGPHLFRYPFLCLKKEWLFVEIDGQLASCALHKNDIKIFHQFPGKDRSFRALMFTESLVSIEKEFCATKKISQDFKKT